MVVETAAGRSAAMSTAGGFADMDDLDLEQDDYQPGMSDQAPEDGTAFQEQLRIEPEDEEVLKAFTSTDAPKQRTLADIIMGKIKEKETEIASQMSAIDDDVGGQELDPKVIDVFSRVGQTLSTYRSGKLTKAFKIIPSLKNWEEILYITQPYVCTKLSVDLCSFFPLDYTDCTINCRWTWSIYFLLFG